MPTAPRSRRREAAPILCDQVAFPAWMKRARASAMSRTRGSSAAIRPRREGAAHDDSQPGVGGGSEPMIAAAPTLGRRAPVPPAPGRPVPDGVRHGGGREPLRDRRTASTSSGGDRPQPTPGTDRRRFPPEPRVVRVGILPHDRSRDHGGGAWWSSGSSPACVIGAFASAAERGWQGATPTPDPRPPREHLRRPPIRSRRGSAASP